VTLDWRNDTFDHAKHIGSSVHLIEGEWLIYNEAEKRVGYSHDSRLNESIVNDVTRNSDDRCFSFLRESNSNRSIDFAGEVADSERHSLGRGEESVEETFGDLSKSHEI